MVFRMRVLGDGQVDSISSTDSDYSISTGGGGSESAAGAPREFQITPAHGSIPPQSEIKVTVRLTSNTVMKYDASLVVDVEGVGDEVVSLPISAKYVSANIYWYIPISAKYVSANIYWYIPISAKYVSANIYRYIPISAKYVFTNIHWSLILTHIRQYFLILLHCMRLQLS